MDIASLSARFDTAEIKKGIDKLDDLVSAAFRAEEAVSRLEGSSQGVNQAVGEVGDAAADAAQGVSAMEATTAELAKAEEVARERIREMVQASLQKRQAMQATVAVTREVAKETQRLNQVQGGGRSDSLGASFAQTQQELEALSDAMAHQAQSLDDVGERRAWVNDLYERGLISLSDTQTHLKTLERQEREVEQAMAAQAREAERLLRTYDPASAAIQKITEDETKLEAALKAGSITRAQYSKAMAGLQVGRAQWEAEATAIQDTAKELNLLALSSSGAFRDYGQLLSALGRGDLRTASNQILQLGIRTNALRAVLTPAALGIGAAVATAGALARAYHAAQQETYELNKAIVMSGNASGVTAGQLQLMAEGIDDIVGTRGAAAETLAMLASTGRVGAKDLQDFATAAQLLARNAGQPVEETVRMFADLGKEPVEASMRLNEQMNYLTESVLKQIQALEQHGDLEAARSLAQRVFYQEVLDRAQRLGAEMPKLTNAAKESVSVFKELWDAASGLFTAETPESRLRDLRTQRGDRELFGGRAQYDQRLFNQDQEEEALAQQIQERDRRIAQKAEEDRKLRDKREMQAKLTQRLQNEKAIADAVSSSRSASIQRELQNSLSQYSAYESQLEAEREAGLISEETYYAEKRRLIKQNRDAQIEAIELENKRLAAESARVRSTTDQLSKNAGPEESARMVAQAQVQIIANQSKIADGEAQIAILRGKEIADQNVLENQRKAAARAIQNYYDEAEAAAQSYLNVLAQQQQRELDTFGHGSRARERSQTRNQIEDRFAQQRLQLESDKRTGPQTDEAKQRYEKDLQVLQQTRTSALQLDEKYWTRREELEGSYYVGAQQAMANYLDSARNVAQLSEDLFTKAFQGMEDALVQFATTGKLDFKSLADSIIADLIRIQLRTALATILQQSTAGGGGGILGTIGSAIGGLFGGAKAEGGDINTGRAYLVGERGPELLIPRTPGTVVPHGKFGGTTINIGGSTIYADSGTSIAQLKAFLDERDAALKGEIANNFYRGRWAAVAS